MITNLNKGNDHKKGGRMHVLLIHLPYYQGTGWSLDLGLAYIAAVLSDAGIEVDVLDINLLLLKKEYSQEILLKKLKAHKYLFIGFGGVFFNFTYFKELSAYIKEKCPAAFQVIGGQFASRIAELLVDNTTVDAVVMGEGEEVIIKIVDCLTSGNPVDTLPYVHVKNKPYVYEFAKVQDLDTIPFPARHLFDMDFHKIAMWNPDPLRYFATMIGTRGCSRSCVFCSPLGGKILRTRSPENIIQEMKELKEKYRIKYFRFNDEVFLGQNKKVLAFCDALEKSELNIVFSIWSWSENLREEAIRRLKEVGCNRIQVGIESGSPSVLKEMNKMQNLERVKEKIQLISDYGLLSGSGFLTGTSNETRETLMETKEYIKRLHKIPNFTISKIDFIKFFKGCDLYKLAQERKVMGSDLEVLEEADKNQMYKFVNLTQTPNNEYTEMVKEINKELKWNYYLTYKIRIAKRLFLLDEIDYRNVMKNISLEDIPVIIKKMGVLLKKFFISGKLMFRPNRRIVSFYSFGESKK